MTPRGSRRTGVRSWLAVLALSHAAAVLLPALASAQPTIAVLGLKSDVDDEELARALTDKLRAKTAGSPQWTMSSTGASLDQMMMVHDCASADQECLAKVAVGLDVEYLIYGKLVRSSSPPTLRADVGLYAAGTGAITRHADADIGNPDALDPVAVDLVRQLSPEPAPAPTAAVVAPEQAAPVAVEETAGETPDESPASLDWLGYTLLGVSAASLGVTILSWVQIDAATKDTSYDLYRRRVGEIDPTASDVCARADAGVRYGVDEATFAGARDACASGKTFEVLQYVFLAATVVSGGAGAFILLTGDSGEHAATSAPRLALRPGVGPEGMSVSASVRF